MRFFEASVIFEASIDANGSNFLTIFGRHANGYFCAIPNWGIACEMAEPSDTYYNANRLRSVKLGEKTAYLLAQEIKRIARLIQEKEKCAV